MQEALDILGNSESVEIKDYIAKRNYLKQRNVIKWEKGFKIESPTKSRKTT